MLMDVITPHTMEELQDLMSHLPGARVFAGGTDILVSMRQRNVTPKTLISLDRIESLKGIDDRNDEIFIRACTTHDEILRSPLLFRHALVLTKAVRELGSPQIRNMGTIGGNIVTASPAGDTLPPLYVLKAEVEIQSGTSLRRMPVDEFIKGPGFTSLLPGEIVIGVAIPKDAPWNITHYEKVGKRKALAIAIAGLAALIRISGSGVISDARLAWGSLGPTIVVSKTVEAALIGEPLNLKTLENAAAYAREAVSPISDVRGGKEYRRTLAGNLLLRLMHYVDGKAV
jgi:CO/xanthine dehydrogenase FAD-binding subunit